MQRDKQSSIIAKLQIPESENIEAESHSSMLRGSDATHWSIS